MSAVGSPMFACTQCNIAFFYSMKHLQKHSQECQTNVSLRATLQEVRTELSEHTRLLQIVADSVQTIAELAKQSRSRKRGRPVRRAGEGAENEEDASSWATTAVGGASSTPEKQVVNAIAYFRKRNLELPVSSAKLLEVEKLLNDFFVPPAISLDDFREQVRENTSVMRSLLEEFKQVLKKKAAVAAGEGEAADSDNESKSSRGSGSSSSSSSSDESAPDVWLAQNGLSATDVSASLDASGGAHKLLLSKFLQIFRDGFANHEFGFPIVVFDVGQRRRIVKLNERIFYKQPDREEESASRPKNYKAFESWIAKKKQAAPAPAQEEEKEKEEKKSEAQSEVEEDADNIICFPFFVYVNAEIGWKVLRFTDHIYPLFALIQSTILKRGVEHTDSMMSREEKRVNEAFSMIRSMSTDRSLSMTRKLEAEYSERLQMATKLTETVLQFMIQFRKKFFDEFLQSLYDEYSVPVEVVFQKRSLIEARTQSTPTPATSRFSSRSSAGSSSSSNSKNLCFTRSVYVLEDDEEILDE